MGETISKAQLAVIDTIQAVPRYFLQRFQMGERTFPPDIRDRLLTEESRGECTRASAHSIYRLQTEASELFSHLFIVTTERGMPGPTLKEPNFDAHTYFMARAAGEPEDWYAASPANFTREGPDPMSTVFQSESLKVVLDSIQERDGGVWPNEQTIRRMLAMGYEPPLLADPDTLIVTSIMAGDTRKRYQTVILRSCYPRYGQISVLHGR